MRYLDRIRRVADAIAVTTHDEAAYWLGMTVHYKNPSRALTELWLLANANQ